MQRITLQESWGLTGCLHMGFLKDTSISTSCCVPGRAGRRRWYIVKGPWMLCFASDSPTSKLVGLPIPLDGATLDPIGETEFEVHNEHIQADFYGKSTLKRVEGFEEVTFEHVALKQFAAMSRRSRDQWVEVLQSHIDRLRTLPRTWIPPCRLSTSTFYRGTEVAGANRTFAFALFAEFEQAQQIARNANAQAADAEAPPAQAGDVAL